MPPCAKNWPGHRCARPWQASRCVLATEPARLRRPDGLGARSRTARQRPRAAMNQAQAAHEPV
ncbi:hypothetical protein ADJ79_04985 [Ottowia sp. oral taxon 894]|nr:hypothetical protein ADJ79_04985 [Ottowia sp. oral taxon 894]